MSHPPQTPPRQTATRLARAEQATPRSPGGSSLRHPAVRPDQAGVARPAGTRTTSDESYAIKRKVLGGTIGRSGAAAKPVMRSASPLPASPRRQPSSTPLRTDDAKTNLPSPRHTPSRVSLKDQIAAKRRAAQEEERKKKSSTGSDLSSVDDESLLQESFVELSLSAADRPASSLSNMSNTSQDQLPEDVFGRSMKHVIRKAMTTGRLNICSMELEQLPEQLYTKILGMPLHELSRSAGGATPRGPRDAFGQVHDDDGPAIPSYEIEDLTQLKASSNMIKEIDSEIGFFGALRILDLKDNQLTDLPAGVANLLNLTHVDLSRNKLKQIPKAVLLLPRLANLDISHNCLTSVDFSGPLRCTHRSDEGNTFLAAFPSTPTRQPLPEDPNEILPAVKSFNLANNQIKSTTLPAAWPRAMQTLDLGSNAISGTMNFAPLAQLAKLERLNLEGNGIAKGSAPESGGFPALTYLNMKANEIKQIEWIKSIVSTRPIQYRGADEWVAGATATVQEGALEVILAQNPLAAQAMVSIKQVQADQVAHKSADDHDDFVVVEPVRRRLFADTGDDQEDQDDFAQETAGQRRAREAIAARDSRDSVAESSRPTSPELASYWNERLGALEFPSATITSMLDADGCLNLAEHFSTHEVAGRVVSLTFQPCLALKSIKFPSEAIALFARVTTLSITYTSLAQRTDFLGEVHRCFPAVQHLDLSGSLLESVDGVSALLSAGLKTLRLKDGKLNDLAALEQVAEKVRTTSWRGLMLLEELDLRDNEITKLEPALGFLPMKSFLVDGNAFRIPARRVYEKGTPELLRWLKDRMA